MRGDREKFVNDRMYFEKISKLQDELKKKTGEMNKAQRACWLPQNEGIQAFANFIKTEFGAGGATYWHGRHSWT
jgi:hypothetical protein